MPLDVFMVQKVALVCDVEGCTAVSEDFYPNEGDEVQSEDEVRRDPEVQAWARRSGWTYNPETGIVVCPMHGLAQAGFWGRSRGERGAGSL